MKWGTHRDVGLLLWGRRVLAVCGESRGVQRHPVVGEPWGTGRAPQGNHAERGAGTTGGRSLESRSRAQEGWDVWMSWSLVGKAHAVGNVTERQLWARDGGGSVHQHRGRAERVSDMGWRTRGKVQVEQNGCEGVTGTPPVTDRTCTAS